MIVQTQVEGEKYTFAEGLRSIVRQDPDIIMVGEIRDGETANIAIEAALTGHFVFSTLHTNDAAGTFPRLADLGVGGILADDMGLGKTAQTLAHLPCSLRQRLRQIDWHGWARLGQFWLDDGVVDGRRLLPPGWMQRSTTPSPGTGYLPASHLLIRLPPRIRSHAPHTPHHPEGIR